MKKEDFIGYQFKTEEEFITEFGLGWTQFVNWSGGMNYLFGEIVDINEIKIDNNSKYLFRNNDWWVIESEMILSPLEQRKKKLDKIIGKIKK